ncbi:MAG: BON domain-containing protein, partial [Deltaproteobacteria bacterium]|nr:BON domain-containing protein [Deltaproteobacteria bacterium]
GYDYLNVASDSGGRIVVTGAVKDSVDLIRVRELVSSVDGVADFDTSNLRVEPRPEPPGPTPTLVKNILANRGYPTLEVSLVGDRFIVFIVDGEVDTSQDFEKVGQIISSIPGIKDIENRIKIRRTPPPPAGESFTHSVRPQLWSTGLEQVQQMINYASNDGGVNRETEIADARRRIEELGVKKELPAINITAARAANMRGLDEQKRGRTTEAFQAFREAYKSDPGDVEVVNNLGYTYMRRGDESSSEQALMLALLLAPDRSGAWAILGRLYATQGKESAAVACFANTYRFSKDKGRTRQFLNGLSGTDGNSKVRVALRTALDLPLLRGQPLDPGGKQNKNFTGLNWVVHRMKTLLQSSGYSDITVQQTGQQEITLGGVVRSEEESIKVRDIAGGEARGKSVVVKWDFQIKR